MISSFLASRSASLSRIWTPCRSASRHLVKRWVSRNRATKEERTKRKDGISRKTNRTGRGRLLDPAAVATSLGLLRDRLIALFRDRLLVRRIVSCRGRLRGRQWRNELLSRACSLHCTFFTRCCMGFRTSKSEERAEGAQQTTTMNVPAAQQLRFRKPTSNGSTVTPVVRQLPPPSLFHETVGRCAPCSPLLSSQIVLE